MDKPSVDPGPAPGTVGRDSVARSVRDNDADLRRRYGVTAGALFVFGGLSAIPGALLLTFDPAAAGFIVIAAAIGIGIACLVAPWERLSWRWFHLVNVVAIVLIALSNAAADRTYAIYYVFPALVAGYVFRSRRAVAGHVAFIAVALMAPMIYSSEPARVSAITAVGGLPAVVLVAASVLFLRERLEARERSYRRLAEEAVRISIQLRLRGRHNGGSEAATREELSRLGEIAAGLEALRDREHEGVISPGPIPPLPSMSETG